MQDQNSNQPNADTRGGDAFPSPDGPQKEAVTHNLDTGEIEPLNNPRNRDTEDMADLGSGGSDGGSGDMGTAA